MRNDHVTPFPAIHLAETDDVLPEVGVQFLDVAL